MNPHVERAIVLMQQSRYELAEGELRLGLALEPDDPVAHAFLGMCLIELGKHVEATEEAQAAIALAPDFAIAHRTHARALLSRNRPDEALEAIENAIRLDPDDPESFAGLAAVRVQQRRWADALAATEQGLQLDPENHACVNYRAMVLTKLGRREEAGATIASALSRNPEDAYAHANQGWTCLHSGDHAKAVEHFREALRLEPDMEWARLGILEAMKARHAIYRLLLRYLLFMSTLSGGARWGIMIGAYVLYRILGNLARKQPELAGWLMPVLGIYVFFVILTWVGQPVFNSILRLDRFGRLALSSQERLESNWVLACILAAVAVVVVGVISGEPSNCMFAVIPIMLILPIHGAFQCDSGWPRNAMAAYAFVLVLAGMFLTAVFALPNEIVTPQIWRAVKPLVSPASTLFVFGIFGAPFAVNALAGVRPKR